MAKRRFGKRRFGKRRFRKGKKLVRIIKHVVAKNQEHKFFDTNIGTSVNANGFVSSLCEITQGGADYQRNGDTIMPSSLYLRFYIGLGDTTNTIRYLVIRWNAPGTPTIADILEATYIGAIQAPYSQTYHDGRSDFNILWQHTYVNHQYRPITVITKKILLKNHSIQYSAGTTTGKKGKLYLVGISDSTLAPHPTQDGSVRLNFTDS